MEKAEKSFTNITAGQNLMVICDPQSNIPVGKKYSEAQIAKYASGVRLTQALSKEGELIG